MALGITGAALPAPCSTRATAGSQPDKAYAQLHFGDAQSFFSAVEKELDTAHAPVWNYKTLAAGDTKLPQPPAGLWSLPVWNDELYFEYHRGVMTSQASS